MRPLGRLAAASLTLTLGAACRTPPPPPATAPSDATATATATHTATTARARPKPPTLRLPGSVLPRRTRLALAVTPGVATFRGTAEHDLVFAEATDLFWLNAAELELSPPTLTVAGRAVPVHLVAGDGDFVGFALDAPLAAGTEGTLRVEYGGQVSGKDDRGLFAEQVGADAYLFTQLENVEARRVFPCFDEPSFKVPWQVTLDVPADLVALSNTPVAAQTALPGGRKRLVFAETKPLPSYLVAFAVGPFELVELGRAGRADTAMRIAVPRGDRAGTRYLASILGPLVEAQERFFDLPYPYEKLDVVLVPHLVSFAAMENAGLITMYRDGAVARPEEETAAFQRNCAMIITHELAHQWFGDLVTLAWWDDVWLNESFASWMEAEILMRWRPEWRWSIERGSERAHALNADRLASVRRLRQAITSNDDIQNAFDGVSYAKGSAVLTMFQTWLGGDVMRDGIHRYLTRHAHGTTTSADFFRAISEAAGRDVAPAFSSFLDQPGVPALRFQLDTTARPPVLHLQQSRHLPVGSTGDAAVRWQIPVCVRYDAGADAARACTLLTEAEGSLVLDRAAGPPRWVLANERGEGYWVSAYDEPALTAALAAPRGALTLEERLTLLHDAGALLTAGRIPAAAVLAHLPALMADPSPHVQGAAVHLALALPERAIPDALRSSWARFLRETFGPRARALGLLAKPGEPDEVRLLRPTLLDLVSGRGEDRALAAEAKALALRWLDAPSAVPEESVDGVLGAAAHGGDRALFDRLHAALGKETDSRRRGHILEALGSFHDPELAKAAILLYLGDELDPREASALVSQGPRVQEVTYAVLTEHYERYLARLPNELHSYAPFIGRGFCDPARATALKAFFADRVKTILGGPRRLDQALESITLCAALKDSQAASLAKLLKR